MITVTVVDTGDYYLKKKTIQSLGGQETHSDICLWNVREDSFRESLNKRVGKNPEEASWYLFLQTGTEVCPGALERLLRQTKKIQARWYYFDEKKSKEYVNESAYEKSAKPDFGVFGFASYLYPGSAVLFSESILSELLPQIRSQKMSLFLFELTIKAAAVCDGCHIEVPLLQNTRRQRLTKEEGELLNSWLNEYLRKRQLPYFAVADVESGVNHLYRNQLQLLELPGTILVLADPEQSTVDWKALYEGIWTDARIIVEDTAETWGKKCNRGIGKAVGDLIFILQAGWIFPDSIKRKDLLGYGQLPQIGTVSPKLYDRKGRMLYDGGAQVAHGFCTSPSCRNSECIEYTNGVREIIVPAWQCFITRKSVWEQVGGFSEETLSADFCAADYALRVSTAGFSNLYCGNIAVWCAEEEAPLVQRGFCHMLSQWKDRWGKDPFFTQSMCRKIFGEKKQNSFLYIPQEIIFREEKGKRILILSHELSMTGAPVVLTYAVRVLKEAGFQQVVLSPEDGVLRKEIENEQVPVFIDEDIYESDRWLSYAKEFDLIIVNTVVPFFCIEQLKDCRIPVIWWIHDAREGYEHYLKHVLPKTLGKNIDVYCVSDYARKVLLEFRPGYQSGVFPYGLPDLSEEKEEANVLEGTEGKVVFLTVGTIESRKGQDVLLEAIEQLDDSARKQSMFFFIGKKKSKDISAKLEISMKKYPEIVRWIPFLSRADIFDAYRQATAVICASRDDPMPTFMAETMMQSGICICSENTGTASLIRSGENGFVYGENSPEKLAACIAYVVKNYAAMDSVRCFGRKTYEEYFALPVFRKNLLEIVEKQLNQAEEPLS